MHGTEWYFGQDGIECQEPRHHDVHVYRTSIPMGTTCYPEAEVKRFMNLVMSKQWQGEEYDMLERNCCSFAEALCQYLVGRAVPDWVTRFPRVASKARQGVHHLVHVAESLANERLNRKFLGENWRVKTVKIHGIKLTFLRLAFVVGKAHTASFFGSPKMLKNIGFYIVFTMFYCTNAIIYTSLDINKVGPKNWFLQCFQCSDIPKPLNISLFTVFFFSFCPFFPYRTPPKMTQNSSQYPLRLQHPKSIQKTRKHQQNPQLKLI